MGTVLYLDLDTIITGPLEPVVRVDTAFAALRDFYRPQGLGSGVVLWNGDHSEIWRQWKKFGKPILPGGDQEWLEYARGRCDRLQDLLPGRIHSYNAPVTLQIAPPGCSIICCHGEPRPHQINGWVKELYWHERNEPARALREEVRASN